MTCKSNGSGENKRVLFGHQRGTECNDSHFQLKLTSSVTFLEQCHGLKYKYLEDQDHRET